MRKMLIILTSVLFITSVYAEDYIPSADFDVDSEWNFNGAANFSD